MNSQIDEDKALSQRLSAGVTAETVTKTLTRRYGRGWQSALAEVLGLSSKTVNDWMRKKKLPCLAQIAIGAVINNRSQIQGRWSVVQHEDEYLVCDTGGRVGRVVARTKDLADAVLIAAAPVLKDALDETSWVYESYREREGLVAAQDATEEDADSIDPGLTALREAELATSLRRTDRGDVDDERETDNEC
jgi:hypothetical protein